MEPQHRPSAIERRFQPKYQTRNEAIIAGLRLATGTAGPIDPYMRVMKRAAEVAYLMALIHGGDWRIDVDHEVGSVVVRRR